MRELDSKEFERLEALSKEWLPASTITGMVGVDPADGRVGAAVTAFAQLTNRGYEDGHGNFSRHTLELWLQHSRHLSFQEAALRVGMKEESLRRLLTALHASNRIPEQTVGLPDSLVSEEMIRGFNRNFSALRGRIFGSHSDFCAQLHEAAREELAVEIESVRCTVSTALDETPDYAYYRCAVSHDPVGLRHAVAMDSQKPIRLLPDYVSRCTLFRGLESIAPKLLGAAPTYDQLLQSLGNACQ